MRPNQNAAKVEVAPSLEFTRMPDLDDLVLRFERSEDCEGGWNHLALVRVALAIVNRVGSVNAYPVLREGIHGLNRRHQRGSLVEGMGQDGYHETLTQVWIRLAQLALEQDAERDPSSYFRMVGRLVDSKLPLRFYSPQLLFSPEAKARWQEPDAGPLALPPQLPAELAELWGRFACQTISMPVPGQDCQAPQFWTHEAHLWAAVAAHRVEPQRALERLREGIQKLNARNGVAQTPEGGYHETLTCLWSSLVEMALARLAPDEPAPHRAVAALLSDRNLPLRFYHRDTIMSWKARQEWVEPDRAPLELDWESDTN